jgi:hypothetical protein
VAFPRTCGSSSGSPGHATRRSPTPPASPREPPGRMQRRPHSSVSADEALERCGRSMWAQHYLMFTIYAARLGALRPNKLVWKALQAPPQTRLLSLLHHVLHDAITDQCYQWQ